MGHSDRTAAGGRTTAGRAAPGRASGADARFVIQTPADAPDGQRAALALAPRGTAFRWQKGRQNRLVLHHDDGTIEQADSGPEMLELIERAHPDQPLHPRDPARLALHRALIVAARAAERRLDEVLAADRAGDLDLALHFLFRSLEKIEDAIEPPPRLGRQPLSNLDVMLAPLMWRILLLDRTELTFVLSTLPRLAARARWLMEQIEVIEIFDARAAERFMAARTKGRSGTGVEPPEDWSRALGPAGREARLIPWPRRQA